MEGWRSSKSSSDGDGWGCGCFAGDLNTLACAAVAEQKWDGLSDELK